MIAGSILGILAVGSGQGGGILPGSPGNLQLITRNAAAGFGFADNEWIDGERIPAISFTFSFQSNNAGILVQQPRILQPPYGPNFGAQITDLYVCCYDGSAILSAQIDPASLTKWIAITFYKYNSGVLRYAEWVSDFTKDFPLLINVGGNKSSDDFDASDNPIIIENIIVINPGKFVVKVNPVGSDLKSFRIPFITYAADSNYSAEFIYERTDVDIDIDVLLPDSDYIFMPPGGVNEWSFDTYNAELAITLQVVTSGFAPYSLIIKIDTLNYVVLSHELVGGWVPGRSSMALLTTKTAEANLDVTHETFDEGFSNLSYGTINVLDPTDEDTINFTSYVARLLSNDIYHTMSLVDESSEFHTNISDKMSLAMEGMGYVVNDAYQPLWKRQGYFVPDNAYPLARTQTFHGNLFGYYAWYGWPTTDASGWSSLGLNAGLPTVAAFEGPDAFPSVYGPHLGIGFGYVAEGGIDDGGQAYFVLAARDTYGSENWKITATGLSTPLYTVDAEYGEFDVQWPGHYGWAWLLPSSGIPLDWIGAGPDRFVTIQNLDVP